MGNRGKLAERDRARELRAQNWTVLAIATELGVSKGSVSLWVRDVPFTPSKRRYGPRVRPNKLMAAKAEEIEFGNQWGREQINDLSEQAFFAAGVALYSGEGAKTDGTMCFANTNPHMILFYCKWLRHFFDIDEKIAGKAVPSSWSRHRGRHYFLVRSHRYSDRSIWQAISGDC